VDKENTNVVQRGMKNKPRRHEDVTGLVVVQKVLLLEAGADLRKGALGAGAPGKKKKKKKIKYFCWKILYHCRS
jgi:hypothetical protein